MPGKEHQPTLKELRSRKIAEQTAAFLKAGGQIKEVPPGASGKPSITELKKSEYGRSIRGSLS
ncbi:hypothetical protein H0A36_24215 [Endozoicomonas sp. SM1973]|uniref:Transcriptional regulator SutA RNAP-binding domain-containing protein n=1 Tax=Spartinivicinus marinus TaxID=2994442 RepID=A0A853I8G7_9GAMM|nr:hypothetical protein [Spartinivicinus marinus]NYZ69129.1 hypothetical protein [Spartinivicinus marinus]